MKYSARRIRTFFAEYLWRIDETRLTPIPRFGLGLLKRLVLAIDSYLDSNVANHASSLTYSSILATVPILAIVFAIGRGFGYGSLIEQEVRGHLGVSPEMADTVLDFINSYLEHTQNGIFVGVGLLLLIYTLIQLTGSIELAFNSIWQVKSSRNVYRRITDYLSVFLLLPVLIVVSSGFSIFMLTMARSLPDYQLLSETIRVLISFSPYLLSGLAFTCLYVYMPNTNVRFVHALFPGFLAGAAFQAVQYFYIHSQLWVSGYNAIYGSFAALPLFMLWLQISWNICLFGVVLSYSNQNVTEYSSLHRVRNLSRRYRDFLTIVLAAKVCKRYEKGIVPYTPQGLAAECHLPLVLVNELLNELCRVRILTETLDAAGTSTGYLPAEDINNLSVGTLLERLDAYGDERHLSYTEPLQKKWEQICEIRSRYALPANDVLLKNL